ncbi:MAG: DUF5693 family protein [Armatimonas sp.]
MVTATIPGNVQRFLLAARERNIRVLYVRLFPDEREPLDTNARYVKAISEGLKERGFEIGPAHGFQSLTNPMPLRAIMGAGLAAGILLLIDALTGLLAGGSVGLILSRRGCLRCHWCPACPERLHGGQDRCADICVRVPGYRVAHGRSPAASAEA